MRLLPTDVSNFRTLVDKNYVYVDKTKYVYDLFSTGSRFFFLSRPRRFGKTLLLSTLKEIFLGNKELFSEQWIYKSDYDWQKYIVIHLDFSVIAHRKPEHLEESISLHLDDIAKQYEIDLTGCLFEDKLNSLIKKLGEKGKLVLLVDEYDHPILKHIKNFEVADKMRETLRSFYDGIKGMESYFHAIFITGVTKFTKTSIFSGINNLNDISIKPEASALLGYTQQEIEKYFSSYIDLLAKAKKINRQEILDLIKNWYNGYRFSVSEIKVYNPFSLLYCLRDLELRNYWFETGTPTFLFELAKNQLDDLEDLRNIELTENSLGEFEINKIPLIPILFQTGYLTISAYNSSTKKYTLSFPNEEVSESFNKNLMASLTDNYNYKVDRIITIMTQALEGADIERFCVAMKTLFAHIPYQLHIAQERYFHSLFQLLGTLLGLEMESEISTDKGRSDLVLITKERVYIFELKYKESAQAALKQIEDRKYYEKFLLKNKQIILVGLSFNYQDGQLELDCQSKTLNQC